MVEQRGLDFISKKKKKQTIQPSGTEFPTEVHGHNILHPLKAGVLPQLYAKGFYAMLKKCQKLSEVLFSSLCCMLTTVSCC